MSWFENILDVSPAPSVEVRWQHGNRCRGYGIFELIGSAGDNGEGRTRYEITVYLKAGHEIAQDIIFVDAANSGAALNLCIKTLTEVLEKKGLKVVYVRGQGPDL